MSVAQWLELKTAGPQRALVRRLLGLVAATAPEATVSIKWGHPVFEHHGPFAYIRAAKNHVTLGFWRGAELTDPHDLLEGGARMSHIKISFDTALAEDTLRAFVTQAVRLNARMGDPTRVARPRPSPARARHGRS
jgi:hypothetical protein